MSRITEARQKLNEILATQVPADAQAELRSFYQQQVRSKQDNIEPLLSISESALRLIPGFLRDKILDKAEAATKAVVPIDFEEVKSELINNLAENYHHEESLKTLIHDLTSDYPPPALGLEDLQDLYCHLVYYDRQTDNSLDAMYQRMANFTRFVPNFVLAQVVKLALSPYIGARVTEHLGNKEAAELSDHFSDDFLGDLVTHLSPGKTAEVTTFMKWRRVGTIIHYMLSRDYYPHMAGVLDAAPADLVQKMTGEVHGIHQRAGIIQFLQNPEIAKVIADSCDPDERAELQFELQKLGSHHAPVFA